MGLPKMIQRKLKFLTIFFSSVFTLEDDSEIPSCEGISSNKIFEKININVGDVMNILKSLNVNKSCGPDGVHPRVLKELSIELCKPLEVLFEKTKLDMKIPKDC